MHQVFRLLQYRNQQLPEVIWKERFVMLRHQLFICFIDCIISNNANSLAQAKKQDQLNTGDLSSRFLHEEFIPSRFSISTKNFWSFPIRLVYQFQYGCKPVHTADHMRQTSAQQPANGLFSRIVSAAPLIFLKRRNGWILLDPFCWAALAARGIMAEDIWMLLPWLF